ncbi:hypothetical protein DPMN_168179 [Dreissena polymorpha]|uniref:Uncharacterized protein n=1 Tax=Dreissena polymorpha TaxID=45954 RepID=A0A9D4F4L9_DREPO|nr:hypothetical protein DPMN_168179 [Dreissena polymorpha]
MPESGRKEHHKTVAKLAVMKVGEWRKTPDKKQATNTTLEMEEMELSAEDY